MPQQNKGMVLLMVLAVLTLLCLLGLMFVMMANMERATARAYLDMVRCKMIAQSGIHAAVVNTRALLTEKGFDIEEMEYHGEDWNDDKTLTKGLEQYEDQDSDHKLQILDCPLYRAVRPSFMANLNGDKDADGNDIFDERDLVNVQGKWVGISGIMPGPYSQNLGAYYTLKVEDLSGKIHINHIAARDWRKGDIENNPNYREYLMFRRVMENLTEELLGKKSIGRVLSDEAPYANWDEIKIKLAAKGIHLTGEEENLLKTCITTYAWRDSEVITPAPLELRFGDETGISPDLGREVFTWRTIRPLMIEYPHISYYGGQKQPVGRAPVNINGASRSVLIALLRGLSGLWLNEIAYFQPASHYSFIEIYYDQYEANPNKHGSLGSFSWTEEIKPEQAQQIADIIMLNRDSERCPLDPDKPWRGRFRSWQQFNLFCDEVFWKGNDPQLSSLLTIKLTPQQADVLKANFNPNSNLPEFNPPYQRLFWVGKDNLWRVNTIMGTVVAKQPGHSFEFSFFPTGYFMVTSLGRLLGPARQVISEAEIQAVVKLFSLYRETGQQDFLEDFWKNDESIYRVIKRNDSTLQTTHDDLTLQAYPEILEYDTYQPDHCRGYRKGEKVDTEPGRGNPYIQDAGYDGYITLATVANKNLDPIPDFQASYSPLKPELDPEQRLKADTGEVLIPDTLGPHVNRLLVPAGGIGPELDTLRNNLGSLFPDGVYSERDAIAMYSYMPPDLDYFAVSMWLKPHFFPEAASKTRVFLTYQIMGTALPPYGEKFYNVFPLGIYSIVNDVEGGWSKNLNLGYDYAGGGLRAGDGSAYDNASFLACGAGTHAYNCSWGGGIITPCLNHIGTLPSEHPPGPTHNHPVAQGEKYLTAFNRDYPTIFKAGKWMHLAWVHQTGSSDPAPATNLYYDVLWVNGIKCDGMLSDIICHNTANNNNYAKYYHPDNILRLGEKRSAPWLNSAPDATIDELCIWPGHKLNLNSPGLNTGDAPLVLIDQIWRQGRYYSGNDGFFTSRSIDLATQENLPEGTPMTVFMVNWTQYVPEQKWTQEGYEQGLWWQLSDPSGYAKPPCCEIGLADQNWAEVLLRGGTLTDCAGSLVRDFYTGKPYVTTDPIRYRVHFKPNVDPLNDILVDPLIFDDITIIYYSVPRFLSWAYRR